MQVPHKLSKKWMFALIGMILLGISGSVVLISITWNNKPNLVDEEYYEQGRKYEATVLQQIAEREALGWDMKLQIPSTLVGETITYLLSPSGTYQFYIQDKTGLALSGAKVTLFAYRPSDSKADLKVKMIEESAGNYQAYLDLPLKGAWMLTAQARQGSDVSEITRNVYLLPPEQ